MLDHSPSQQRGFGAIELFLILVVVAVLVAAGGYVYYRQHKSNTTGSTSQTNNTTPNPQPDPYAGWKAYTSTSGKFSLKYPKTWATATNPSQCQDGILLLGADSNSVGACGSNDFGQMTVTWQPVRTSCGLTATYWTPNSTQPVTVSGVSGTESAGTAKAGAAVPEGTTTIQYCFVKGQTMYTANYTQLSTYPNVLSDFETMVTKTLTFD